MIEAKCVCGAVWRRPESGGPDAKPCSKCGRALVIACAEELPEKAGIGDFDAVLDVRSGPTRRGERIFLGGVVELPIGKLPTSKIALPGQRVSRLHCKLARVDFGPSKWSISDNQSTNGLFVNGRRVEFKELEDGDVIRVGEYELVYGHVEEARVAAAVAGPAAPVATSAVGGFKVRRISDGAAAVAFTPGTGVTCPSCATEYPGNSKICVSCGVKLDSGRPVLLSAGADEDYVHGTAETIIRWVSWLMPVTPLPMPIASEAFGRHKPWAIRGIAAVTVLASLIFLIGTLSSSNDDYAPGSNLMLWPTETRATAAASSSAEEDFSNLHLTNAEVRQLIDEMDANERAEFDSIRRRLKGTVPNSQLDRRAIEVMMTMRLHAAKAAGRSLIAEPPPPLQFQPYQLLTHAFLHDNSSIFGFITHLGGNLLFMLVFGSRVNALLGNVATLIIYPILAVGAAAIYLALGHPHGPMLGASGAIMGLAGMYLILFPVHRVYCGMWLRIWLRFRTWLFMKVFVLRGFWVLLIYFAYDALMVSLNVRSGTAHWAHVGGFLMGVTIALALLTSRLFNCGGGDLLSVMLGKYAWALIGRPARWNRSPAAAGAATASAELSPA